MIFVLAAIAVLQLAVLILATSRMDRERAGWADERRELLNRIQQPQFIPTGAADGWKFPENEPDEIGLVGTVAIDPEYLGD